MIKLLGVILVLLALYWFVAYWPSTVSSGAMVTAQTQITRAINQ